MFSQDRKAHRQVFVDAWAKARSGQPLEPLETQIVQILRMHPEYLGALEEPDGILDRDYLPEAGESNPFLHLGLHIAILEQTSIDRPAGVRKLHRNLTAATGDVHEADHRIMECLAEALWRVQRDGKPFDDKAYLKCVRRAGGGSRPRDR
jgi:hypothetical protein